MAISVQDRTDEFRSVLSQVQRRQASSKAAPQRRALLTDAQRWEANGGANGDVGAAGNRRARSEFARKAAEIGRGITGTMAKLERLTQREYGISRDAESRDDDTIKLLMDISADSGEAKDALR